LAAGALKMALTCVGVALAWCAAADAAPPRASNPSLSLGPTSQYDLSKRVPLTVRVRLPRRGDFAVAARVVERRAVRRLSPAFAVRGPGVRLVTLRIEPGISRHLGACRRRRVEVVMHRRHAGVVARTGRALASDPPRCGRFFGPATFWNRRLAPSTPIDRLSRTLVDDLRRQVEDGFAKRFPPTINTTSYSTPVYTVAADQRRVPVTLVGGRTSWGGALARTLAAGVPIPARARPAAGSDHHLVIWQPARDVMWELWATEQANGRWEAQWGGRMTHVSRSPGYFYDPSGIQPGATATSLPLAGGLMTQADLARHEITHALAMAIPSSRYAVWAKPAQRSDGGTRSDTAIPQGARFRLDPKLDLDAMQLPPFTAMMARAAQRYGIFVRDTSPTVTFYAQDPVTMATDPWPAAITPSAPEILRRFPWEHLQVVRMDLRTYPNRHVPH
jgi:hypothetical protein